MASGQGLVGLLQRRSNPAIICSSGPAQDPPADARLLLVDGGAALQAAAGSNPATAADGDDEYAQRVYLHTCRLLTGLKRTGLRQLVVLPESLASELSSGSASDPAHVAAGAFHLGLLDMQVELFWAKGSQHPLLLDLYLKNKSKVEAVLTDDAGYFVYGVEKFGFLRDTLIDCDSTTLMLWNCEGCWKKWRLAVGGRYGNLSPLERAQVAVLLGTTAPREVVEGMEAQMAAVSLNGSGKGAQLLCSATVAATMALAFDASDPLPMKFFQEVMGITRFGEEDLQSFRRAVEELLFLVSKTKGGSVSEDSLPQPPEVDAVALKEALMPGVMTPTPKELLDPEEGTILAVEDAVVQKSTGVVVEVGSSLTKAEWDETDDKDIVSKTRNGTGFRIMQKIPAFDPQPPLPTAPSGRIDEDCVWELMYAKRKDDKAWRRVAEAVFPRRWEEAHDKEALDKAKAKELKKLTEEKVMEKVASLRDSALSKRTKEYMQLLPGKDAESMLALRREAIVQGSDSVAWRAAEACWNFASSRIKSSVLTAMFTCDNKAAIAGPPGRYPHQEELLRMIHEHLNKEPSTEVDHSIPLQIELSTPTGSGKTFAALMVHLQLLKVHHPDSILVYSVPTKTVLKTVGQACEAHALVYWTAASLDGNKYQIRRPYSIRTGKTKGEAGSTDMATQLTANREEGKKNNDRGNGKPDVIIADIQATAALMEAAAEEDPKSPFHNANMVLYFDEPNMGVHLNPKVRETVSKILNAAPFTMVLASATLPPWSRLDPWWRVGGKPATRATITLEPYELPQANLEVLDELRQELRTTNLLSLFRSHEEFCDALRGNKRLQISILRHLTPKQGLDLLGADVDSENTGFGLVHGEVSTLREAMEANLASLMDDKDRFEEVQTRWTKDDTMKSIDTSSSAPVVSGVISKTGITLIATQDARKLALEIAGKHDERTWNERMHRLNSDRAQAAKLHKEAEKEKARRKNDDGQDGDGAVTGYVRLRDGIQVSLADADNADQEELLMLGAGIAYSSAKGVSPLVQRLYQQTLLSVPEKVMAQSRKLPPIHVLVVDYSAIYGTDCPAVDTLVMVNELGKALTWQDHQQFMGRLRRDGRAIYCSLDTLRHAAVGIGMGHDGAPEPGSVRAVSLTLLQAAAKGTTAAKLAPKLEEARKEAGILKRTLSCHVAVSMFARLLGAPSDARAAERKAYGSPVPAADIPEAMQAAVTQWGPMLRHFARSDEDQAQIISTLQALAEGKSDWGEAGKSLMDMTARMLKILYDEDVVSEEAIFAWESQTRKAHGDSRFLKLAGPLVTWLREADEEESEEEDDE